MQNTVGKLMECIVVRKLARDLRTGKYHTPYKSGRGSGVQTRKVHMGKCSYVCIWCVQQIPEKEQTVAVAVILEDRICSSCWWTCSFNNYGVSLRTHLHFLGSMQNMNHKSLNSHYHHEAAISGQPWPSSSSAIWFLSRQMVCAIRQFSGIWMHLLFACATSVKFTFDL